MKYHLHKEKQALKCVFYTSNMTPEEISRVIPHQTLILLKPVIVFNCFSNLQVKSEVEMFQTLRHSNIVHYNHASEEVLKKDSQLYNLSIDFERQVLESSAKNISKVKYRNAYRYKLHVILLFLFSQNQENY